MRLLAFCGHFVIARRPLRIVGEWRKNLTTNMGAASEVVVPVRRSSRLQSKVKVEPAVVDLGKRRRNVVKEDQVPVKVKEEQLLAVKPDEKAQEDDEKKTKVIVKKEEVTTVDDGSTIKKKRRVVKKKVKKAADIEDCCLPPPEDVEQILSRLSRKYGGMKPKFDHPKTKASKPVLDSLVATILSQNTTNHNSSRAFRSLKQALPTWDEALKAGPSAIEESIRAGGLAKIKAGRIHVILEDIKTEQGKLDLEYLREYDDEKAKQVLCGFKGVGPKTASCVLMFNMGRGEFPVDTHVRRLCARLGWVPESFSREKVYDVMNNHLRSKDKYSLHVLLIKHGKQTCRPSNPKCYNCPLTDKCQYAKSDNGSVGSEDSDGSWRSD